VLVQYEYENPATRKKVNGLQVDASKRPGAPSTSFDGAMMAQTVLRYHHGAPKEKDGAIGLRHLLFPDGAPMAVMAFLGANGGRQWGDFSDQSHTRAKGAARLQ
jgi:hypothetical protein